MNPILPVPTAVTAFLGSAVRGPVNEPVAIGSFGEYEQVFGGLSAGSPLGYAVRDFFLNGGSQGIIVRLFRPDPEAPDSEGLPLTAAEYLRDEEAQTGLFALEKIPRFNLLCLPPPTLEDGPAPHTPAAVYPVALDYCVRRRALLLVDPPQDWTTAAEAAHGLSDLGLTGDAARNAALYFPRLREADPVAGGQRATFVPCGAVAGVMARTDAARGVWKAPSGQEAMLHNVLDLSVTLTEAESASLTAQGINGLRSFPNIGSVIWGARTLVGADRVSDEYKFVPVRRLALFLEESLLQGLVWTAFEPNAEPLWAQIRRTVENFLQGLFQQGAFAGQSSAEAYFVLCGAETTTAQDRAQGRINVVVGFAPLRRQEFWVLRVQQKTA